MKTPERYKKADWGDVPPAIQDKIRAALKGKKGVYFHGGVGSGKTHIIYALAGRLEGTGARCRVHNTTELIFDIRRDISRDVYTKARWDEVLAAYEGVLVLDDIGAEKATDFVMDTLYLIINARYVHCLPTVFTSNLPIGELAEKIGDRTASRIVEMCDIVKIDGQDRRILSVKKNGV